MSGPRPVHASPLPAVVAAAALLSACGGPGASPSSAPPARASDAEWQALAAPRPAPLPGAPTVALGPVQVLGELAWPTPAAVEAELGVTELAAAGLLGRRDVRFVERRRFAAAAEAERRGQPRPPGAPAAGTSPGARFVAAATWTSTGLDSARVDVRLTDPGTGAVVAAWRGSAPAGTDPVAVARAVTAGVLAALDEAGVRPAGAGPAAEAAATPRGVSGVGAGALAAFLQGLAAEERWNWEEARMGYQRALAAGGDAFPEAAAALARAARLRNGGTLGEG